MIIFLYGLDTYRSRQKLNEIIGEYKKIHKNGFNFRVYDFSSQTNSFYGFKNEVQQKSMFKEKKMIVLKNSFFNQKLKDEIIENKKLFLNPDDNFVFFEEDNVLEADKLTKFLKKNGKAQKFELLKGKELEDWLKKEFSLKKISIESRVPGRLIDFVGNDIWRLANEINKLANYKKNKQICLEDVNLLVKPKIETAIFETIETISRRDRKIALRMIEKHLEKGESAFYLLTMISYQFRNLLLVKLKYGQPYGQKSKFGGLKLHPYVEKKALEIARSFSLEELKRAYQLVFLIDLEIKTGKLKPEDGLRMLAIGA